MTSVFAREVSTERLRDGDHLVYAYLDESQLATAVSEFVRRGLSRNQTNLFLVTAAEAEKYEALLARVGLDLRALAASGVVAVETVDQWLGEPIDSVFDRIEEQLKVHGKVAREQNRSGLNIIGTIANTLAKQGRYSECLLLEAFWHSTIDQAEMPVTLLCPYESMVPHLEEPLQQTHSSMTRIVRGSADEVARVIDEVIQAAGSDPIDSSMDAVQDRYGSDLVHLHGRSVARSGTMRPVFKIRIIAPLESEDLEDVKRVLDIPGVEIRHIAGVRAKFWVTRREFLTTTQSTEDGLPTEVVRSNGAELIGQMRSVFEILWESAVPAQVKIEELERGQVDGRIRLTFDMQEVIASADRFAEETEREALIIIPGEEEIRSSPEFFQKLAAIARGDGVRVKVLGDFARSEGDLVREHGLEGIRIRNCPIRPSLTLGIFDRSAMDLVQFVRDGDGRADGSGLVSAIISTNAHEVAGFAGIFDALWDESELRQREEKANTQTRLLQDILTHDLRNYSQVTMANAELLKDMLQGNRQTDVFVDRLLRSVVDTNQLIEKANQLGRIASEANPQLHGVDVLGAIERSIALVREARPDRTISFGLRPSPRTRRARPISVQADDILGEVFLNLFSNSVSYAAGREAKIEVRVQGAGPVGRTKGLRDSGQTDLEPPSSSYLKISVTDWSTGIQDDMKERIFNRYLVTSKGHGLGLSIVRALVVERYGGRISIRNRIEGDHTKGTVIEIWLREA
jgi:signal transduction histidine kinase